jgi:threonine synthase
METSSYELRCRECGKTLGKSATQYLRRLFLAARNHLRLRFASKQVSRELFASRAPNIWRYRELLPLPAGYQPSLPVGSPR